MQIQYGMIAKEQLTAFRSLLPEGTDLADPELYAVGAVEEGRACGVLLVRADELVLDVEHLAVAEEYRRQGVADGMIDALCGVAWENSAALTMTFSAADRDAPLCRLLAKRGDFTVTETEDYICRFPCKALGQVELNAAPPSGSRIVQFYSLSEETQRGFLTGMEEDNGEFAAGLREDRARMLDPLCLCTVHENGAVTAAVFCQGEGENVQLAFAYAVPGHTRALMALVARLRDLLEQAADRVPYLTVAAVTPESRKLVETLLPGREVTARFYTACWDMNTMGE